MKASAALLALCAALVLAPVFAPAAEPVRAEGAQIGEWTQDWDAAVALSKEKDVPVFVLFTGSDWCPYCVRLHDEIFSKEGWTSWAGENLVLAFLDFPRDKSLVPEAFRERNQLLQGRYGVEGYPTAFLLTVDELDAVGTFSYSSKHTPESFAKDVADLLPLARRGGLKAALSEAEWERYQLAVEKRRSWGEKAQELEKAVLAKIRELEAAGKDRSEIVDTIREDAKQLQEFRSKQSAAAAAAEELIEKVTEKTGEEAGKSGD